MEYFKTTIEQSTKDINIDIQKAKFNYAIWHVFRTKVLPKFDGKMPSKRILTALKKELPNLSLITYENYHTGLIHHITIYKNKTHKSFSNNNRKWYDIDNKIRIYLNGQPLSGNFVFDAKKIIESNNCHELEQERIRKYKRALKLIEFWVNDNNEILNKRIELNSFMHNYELQYLFTKNQWIK